MFNGFSHKKDLYGKDDLFGMMPMPDKNAFPGSKFHQIIEEKRRREEYLSAGTFEKGIQASKAKNDLVFALVKMGAVLYNHGILEAGKCRVSYFMRLKHNDLVQNASEFIEMARENAALLKKSGLTRTVVPELELKLKRFEDSLEEKVLNYC